MDRRKIYKVVQQLLSRNGGSAALLEQVAEGMQNTAAGPRELASLMKCDDALGRVYQAINAPALEAAYRGTAKDRRKFTAEEIPAVTQLFTPKWVVEFLLQNTLGKLWVEMHPDSRLAKNWKWMTKADVSRKGQDLGGTPMRRAGELRICDPACGTMNFGLVAIDLLREMYREEMDRAGEIGWPGIPSCESKDQINAAIVGNNLVGMDIDPVAIDLAKKSFEIKIGGTLASGAHQLIVGDALFGGKFTGKFDLVVTNPPYLSARNLDAKVVKRLKGRFPRGWRDLYACFILRSLELLKPGGRAGILSMHSFMFTGAFEKLRREIADQAQVRCVAHFGPNLFDVGNPGTLQTAAVVLERKPGKEVNAEFFRLIEAEDKRAALERAVRSSDWFEVAQKELASMPRGAWMYWISGPIRRAFREFPKLGEIAPPRQGLATTDNARFVRYWWEVEPPGFRGQRRMWKPYAKGGRFRRWYESARHRVNWEDDGREIKQAIVDRYPYLDGQWQWVAKNSAWYGREGITYSYLTSGCFSARGLQAGTIFDVAGSSLFPADPREMLGILNSGVVRRILSAINPTVNFQVGDLRQLPVPRTVPVEMLREVSRAIEATRKLDTFDETSPDFERPEAWDGDEGDELRREVAKAERAVDGIVAGLYGVKEPPTARRKDDGAKEELARRWISYALGVWLGRWDKSARGTIALVGPLDNELRRDLFEILVDRAGAEAAEELVDMVGGLDRFLGKDFLPWHNLLYRGRPVFWGVSGNGKTIVVSSLCAETEVMRRAFREIGQMIPHGWRRWTDDGVRINLSPLAPWISDAKFRAGLVEVAAEIKRGRFGFSETARTLGRE